MYGLVSKASVLVAASDRGTIFSSRVDQSKSGRTQFEDKVQEWELCKIGDEATSSGQIG